MQRERTGLTGVDIGHLVNAFLIMSTLVCVTYLIKQKLSKIGFLFTDVLILDVFDKKINSISN